MKPLLVLVALLLLGGLAWWVAGRGDGVESQRAVERAPVTEPPVDRTAPPGAAAHPESERTAEARGSEVELGPADVSDLPLLRGRVVDGNGAPINEAWVLAVAAERWSAAALDVEPAELTGERDEPAYAWTDEAGRFELYDLAPGPTRVAVRAMGFAPLDLDALTVAADAPTELGELVLAPGLVLEGRVVDARGAGVAGATIAREDPGPGGFGPEHRYAPFGHSDEQGTILVSGLAPGRWRVRVQHPEHPTAFFGGVHETPGIARGLVFRLEDGWTIDGRLVVPGLDDLSGYSIAAKMLEPPEELGELDYEHRYRTVECDADGAFRFTGLLAIDSSTRFELEPRRRSGDLVRRVGDAVEVNAGARGVLLHGEALATVRFELRARDDGAPVDGAEVVLIVQGGNTVDLSARGSVEALGPGRYRVGDIERASEGADFLLRFAKEGFRDHLRGQLGLAPGATSDLGVIELERPALLVLTVLDGASGAPVPEAVVAREADSGYWYEVSQRGTSVPFDRVRVETQSGPDGVAHLPLAIGFENRVFVAHPGFALADPLLITPEAAGELARSLRLTRGATLVVRTRDALDRPAPGERVSVRPLADRHTGMLAQRFTSTRRHAKTDAEGVARFEHLRAGPTDVRDPIEEADTNGVVVDLVEGETHEVVLRTPVRADLEVRVLEHGAPLEDARVQLAATGGDPRYEAGTIFAEYQTDLGGRTRFEQVEVGDYALYVHHPTRALAEQREVAVREGAPPVTVELTATSATGAVRDAGGAGLSGAAVLVAHADAAGAAAIARTADQVGDLDLDEPSHDPHVGWTRADAEGHYALRGLPPGVALRAVAFVPGHAPAEGDAFTLAAGEQRALAHLVATAGARLRVVLDVPADEKHKGWAYEVRATRAGTVRRGWFRSRGECTLDHLEAGTWTVALWRAHSGEAPITSRDVELRAGGSGEVALAPR